MWIVRKFLVNNFPKRAGDLERDLQIKQSQIPVLG